MAGDWIKMRNDLPDDPAVISMAAQLGLDEFAVVGRLHTLWAWADEQSRDGHAVGVTSAWLDRKVQRDGFARALESVGWLELSGDGLAIPNFGNHNGETAKVRALGTRRKQRQRADTGGADAPDVPPVVPDVSHDMSRSERDKCETREEKRREEKELTDATASVAAKPPRATRKCPASFDPVVAADALTWIAENAAGLDWKFETEKFRDHTFKNAISDWPGAWRNWMRRAHKDRLEGRGGAPPTYRERDEARAAARVHEMTGGLVSARPAPLTRHNDALQEVFDAAARRLD